MQKRFGLKDIVVPAIILPYGYLGIRVFERGFDLIGIVIAILLFLVVLPSVIVLWSGR